MSDWDKTIDMIRVVFALLRDYAKRSGRPFPEVALEYAVLLRPPTDAKDRIRYCESYARLMGELATFYSGPPVFESKGNQRKLLILRYFSKRDYATSFDVSSDLELSLTNASERLKRYYKQGLLARRALEKRRRGRRTLVYKLTQAGLRRLAFLEKNVKFKRTETMTSKMCRFYRVAMEEQAHKLRQQLASP